MAGVLRRRGLRAASAGWIGAAGIPGMELADPAAMQGWTVLDDWRGKLAAGLLKSRLLPALVLYFAAFTAAGFWMLAGACLIFGLSLGILLSLSAMQMGWMGLLFLACALLPQWLFYGMAGSRIADLVKRKREQAALCPAGPVRDSRWKIVKDFLGTAGAVCCGIGSEMLPEPASAAAVPEIQLINLRKQLDSFALYDIFIPERQRFVVQNIQKQLFRETERRVKDVNTT